MNAAHLQERPRQRLWRRPRKPAGPEALFLEHLALIERVAASAGRRAGMPSQEVEDFVSQVKLKLIDDDYAVLRKHRGDSRLTTYLTTVVHNQFKDYCNHKWGKFRPSAAAKRLGPEAKALERLLVIDRRDLESAIETLKTNHRVETSRQRLREMAAELPQRTSRHFVDDEVLEQRPSEAVEADAERRVADDERADSAARVERVLSTALDALSARDLLIMKMFYRDGLTVAAIASTLRLEARPLYSRKEKCLRTLRAALTTAGLTWDEVRSILGWQGREINAGLGSVENEPGDEVTDSARDVQEK